MSIQIVSPKLHCSTDSHPSPLLVCFWFLTDSSIIPSVVAIKCSQGRCSVQIIVSHHSRPSSIDQRSYSRTHVLAFKPGPVHNSEILSRVRFTGKPESTNVSPQVLMPLECDPDWPVTVGAKRPSSTHSLQVSKSAYSTRNFRGKLTPPYSILGT